MTIKTLIHAPVQLLNKPLLKQSVTGKSLSKSFSSLLLTSVMISVLSLSAVTAQASTPTTESVNRLLSLTPTDKMLASDVLQQAYRQNVISIPQIVEQTVYQQKAKLSDAQKKELETIISDYAKSLGQQLESNKTQLSNKYIQTVQQTYTQEEVDAQIAFYSSAVGQQILKKQPQLLQNYMTAVIPSIQQQVEITMKGLIPKLKADVNRVINK
ncbi:MAG: hypothetical protein CR966_01915 [Pseudomonadales bacterium]|nr:MAG: hypothetical protein CR966_01915 [Pseudomonadales bacterium]